MALEWLGFGSKLTIAINIGDAETRRTVTLPRESGQTEPLFVYVGDEDPVFGSVDLQLKAGKKIEHQGVKLELIGQIELFYDRGNHFEFVSLEKELLPAGVLDTSKSFDFEFANAPKPHECYGGVNVRLRYFLRVSLLRSIAANITKERDLWVYAYAAPPEVNNTIKMEVGIEDCLHIEFEYGKSKYHLKDVVIGKIYFLLVRIKIKHMEIALLKRESTGSGPNVYNESETLTKFEIMDGAPVRGESIPVRLFLGGFDLTPTYRNIENKFSLKYYLNLVLVDSEERRYFKQQEITLYRRIPSGLQLQPQPTESYSGEREKEAAKQEAKKEADIRAENKRKKKEKKRREAEKKKSSADDAAGDDDKNAAGDDNEQADAEAKAAAKAEKKKAKAKAKAEAEKEAAEDQTADE